MALLTMLGIRLHDPERPYRTKVHGQGICVHVRLCVNLSMCVCAAEGERTNVRAIVHEALETMLGRKLHDPERPYQNDGADDNVEAQTSSQVRPSSAQNGLL